MPHSSFRQHSVPIAVLLLCIVSCLASDLHAQEESIPLISPEAIPIPAPDPMPPLSNRQQQEVKSLIEEEVERSQVLDDRIQQEVQNTFGWTINLLNVLVTVLIAIPVVTGVAAFFIRRSVIEQLVREVKRQLQDEQEQLRLARAHLLEQAKADLEQLQADFQQELKGLSTTFADRTSSLLLDAQSEKDRILMELATIAPPITQEVVAPEIHTKIQELTHKLEALESANPQLHLTPDDYLRRGNAFYFDRRYEDAIASYEAALATKPDLIDAWVGVAKVLRSTGEYKAALAASDSALAINDTCQPAWFERGRTLIELDQYDKALQALEQAITIDANRVDPWKLRGYALTKLGQYADAIDSFEQAIELNPRLGGVYYNYAYCLLSQGQIDSALTTLEKAISLYPRLRDGLRTDSDFTSLHPHDRFQSLLTAVQ